MIDRGPEDTLKRMIAQALELQTCEPSSTTEAQRGEILGKLDRMRRSLTDLVEEIRRMPNAGS